MMFLFTGVMFGQKSKLSKFAPENSTAAVMPGGNGYSKFQYESVEIGAQFGLPLDVYDYALGGDVKLNFSIGEEMLLTADLQYTNFSQKNGSDGSFLPIRLGAKHFFLDDFYGGAQLGSVIAFSGGEGAQLAYGLGAGVRVDEFDISINYDNFTGFTGSQLAFRFAYVIK
ncbi:hypothetical protein [Neptunitalea lumnitzerae]|nr:hypothetical protein [Neptunitalea sp. Y10]